MNKQTAALIALFAGWILTADTADATTYEDIAGQWCGDVTDYVFAPNTLTVRCLAFIPDSEQITPRASSPKESHPMRKNTLSGQLTDGIEESDDPLIDIRNGAYALSFSRRNQ